MDIEAIQRQIEELEKQASGKEVLGFKLYKTCDRDRPPQWRAQCYLLGKLRKVHIGRDLGKAEEKIRAWLEKNPRCRKALTKKGIEL